MTILVCIPCLLTGGTEIQTLNLVQALVAGGHRVVTVCYFEFSEDMGYAPESKLRLSTKKLQSLGWSTHYSLHQILDNLIRYISDKSDVD